MHQAGPLFLVTELSIPYYSDAAYCTQLLLDNKFKVDIVNTDGVGETIYKVHLEHTNNEVCSDDCEPVDLKDFVKDHYNLEEGTIANYTNHVYMNFVKLIICDTNSEVYPKYFDSNIQFKVNENESKCIVATWPVCMDKFNMKMANDEDISVDEYTKFIDSILTTSMNSDEIMHVFDLTQEEAEDVADLAEKHQFVKEDDNCMQLPSMITMVLVAPRKRNFPTGECGVEYRNLRNHMEARILCLSEEELNEDVETWLYRIEEEETFRIERNGQTISVVSEDLDINIPEDDEIEVMMEEHGFNLLQAVYHRSLNFSKFSSLDIVLKSSCVGSAFVRPYWPRYLQATRSKVVTTVIGSNYSDVACRLKCGHPSLMTVPGDLLDSFSDSHKQVPNIEAIFRFDKNKGLTYSNMKPVFVNMRRNKKMKFIIAKTTDVSKHYREPNRSTMYELFEDLYDLYFKIPAGYKKASFFQLVAEFKKHGREDEAEEGGDDDDDDEEGEDHEAEDEDDEPEQDDDERDEVGGTDVAMCNDDRDNGVLKLPERMKLENGVILKRRKKPKIVSYPEFDLESDDKMLQDLMLFRPHKKGEYENLTSAELRQLYYETDRVPSVSGLGRSLTKIETVRKRTVNTMSKFKKCGEFEPDFVSVSLK